jgi:predicted DNA binding protein
MKITTTTVSRSFFAKLSKYSQAPIYLFVHRYWQEPIYLVVAYTNTALEPDKLRTSYLSEKGKFLKMKKLSNSAETYLLAVKERCEFYELIENYNATLSIPYAVRDGKRVFCVYGGEADLEKYVSNLRSFYGEKNIVVEKTTPVRCVQEYMHDAIRSYIFSHLTDREKEILFRAYYNGYISSRRRIKLDELAKQLNITKPAASLIVRKTVEKIVKRLLENESNLDG